MWQAIQCQNAGEVCNVQKSACDDKLWKMLIIVPFNLLTMNNKPQDFPTYSVQKLAWHAKITMLIIKFSRSIY